MSALKYEVESWSDIPLPLRIHTPWYLLAGSKIQLLSSCPQGREQLEPRVSVGCEDLRMVATLILFPWRPKQVLFPGLPAHLWAKSRKLVEHWIGPSSPCLLQNRKKLDLGCVWPWKESFHYCEPQVSLLYDEANNPSSFSFIQLLWGLNEVIFVKRKGY